MNILTTTSTKDIKIFAKYVSIITYYRMVIVINLN